MTGPVVRVVELTLLDGSRLCREWRLGELLDGDAEAPYLTDPPPYWIGFARARGLTPGGQTVYRGDVTPGYEDASRRLLGLPVWAEYAERAAEEGDEIGDAAGDAVEDEYVDYAPRCRECDAELPPGTRSRHCDSCLDLEG